MKPLFIFIFVLLFATCSQNTDNLITINYQANAKLTIDSLITKSQLLHKNNPTASLNDTFIIEAITLAKSSGCTNELYNLNLIQAKRYRESAKYGASIEFTQEALMLASLMNSDLLRAKATHETAVNFRKINDNAQALKLHLQALELAENVADTFLIHCSYNGIGNVYFDYKEYAKAIEYFHKSLQFLGTEKPNYLGDAINSNLLGEAWLFIGNTDSALYYINRSFAANGKINSELGKAICHNGMGLVYYQRKDYNTALNEHQKAFEICNVLGDSFYKAMCLVNIGNTYMAMHQYNKAEQFLIIALNVANQIGNTRFALDASLKLGQLYNATGQVNNSYKYNIMAMAYKDTITNEIQKQNTEAMTVLYKTEKQEREILILKQKSELAHFKMTRQRYVFLAIFAIIVLSGLFVMFLSRQRALKSKINEIGLEQKLLRAQLNPHFVFNSLSAVQNFILRNDKQTASEYLVNFSRLMRNILMGSGVDFIYLEQELEMLDDYLKLQQLRFQGKFEYFFELSNNIVPQTCLVPPMLIQPFVENAIEHGVRGLDRQGTIVIRFERNQNNLIIEVEDNGHGIIVKNIDENKKGHISMATKITRQRMQNLQAITKKPCNFEVIDNKVTYAKPGVQVKFMLPWQEDV